MNTIKCYLTKDSDGAVELWKSKPTYDGECWKESVKGEVGTELTDDFLDDCVENGQCMEIQILISNVVTDYNLCSLI